MARTYYTVCKFDTEARAWFDEFGTWSRADAVTERDWYVDDGAKRDHVTIIHSNGSAADMIAKRDALAMPKGFK